MQIELIYESTCPNIKAARLQLLKAFAKAEITPRWNEWEVSAPEAPTHVHGYGSPTVLVNGKDVSGDNHEGDDYCCRVYSHGENSIQGVPALSDVVFAIESAHQSNSAVNGSSRWRLNGAMLPSIGVAFLPKLVCPACWPAYAGLLGALGISFFDYTPYLLPLTAIFLLIALGGLAYRAPTRRGFKPLLVGLLAAGTLLLGKFGFDSDLAMYAGLSLLVFASLWNTWPRQKSVGFACPECEIPDQQQS